MDALPFEEFRRLDLNSEELGVPVRRLMERAGAALAAAVQEEAGRREGFILLLCGKGNNGGDGFAAALRLHEAGRDVRVVLMEPRGKVRGDAARSFLDRLPPDRVEPWQRAKPSWRSAAAVADCLLGSGVSGVPRPPYDAAIRFLQRFDGPVVSCDVPSGLGTALAVRPRRTVTFHAPKEGMDARNSGTITVADIGIPKAASDVGIGDLFLGYPRPGRESHKGQNGVVFVVGGGPYRGAPHYAGMGAYRTGADLVLAWLPERAAAVLESWGPDLLVHACNPGDRLVEEGADAIAERLGRAGALVVGPGLGTDSGTRRAVARLLDAAAEADVPCVVDADGLDAVTPVWLARHGARTVLTPHRQEFADLSGWKPTDANVVRYAREHGVTVLRKGAVDLIADAKRSRRCRRGHPTMTVGGTGDVLAGVTGALLAKGAGAFEAACAAAYLNGRAGETAAALRSYGATATDVHEALPLVLRELEQAGA